ncbi:MAG TPA: hypothetical protein VMV23_05415 [Candidatus Nanopelagicaceae bacterium]|nr:hypothetical protein [Candidatus Nanopelagicaceae bacterium]
MPHFQLTTKRQGIPRRRLNWTSSPMAPGSQLIGFGLECGLVGFILGYWPSQGPAPLGLGTISGTVTAYPGGGAAPVGSRVGFVAPVGNQAIEVGATSVRGNGAYRISLSQGVYQAVLLLPAVPGGIPLSPSSFSVIAGEQLPLNLTYSTAGL